MFVIISLYSVLINFDHLIFEELVKSLDVWFYLIYELCSTLMPNELDDSVEFDVCF